MAATFDEVFASARERYGEQRWNMLSPSEQTAAIYWEMRRIDTAWSMVRQPSDTSAVAHA